MNTHRLVSSALVLGAFSAALQAPQASAAPFDQTALPITTSGIGNTLQRGPAWAGQEPSAQKYVMDYFSGFTASPDGYAFGVTTWEEGIQRVSAYKDGDNIRIGPYGESGTAVAASKKYLIIGKDNGQVAVCKRVPGKAVWNDGDPAPGSYYYAPVSDKPDYIQGVAIDEARDKFYVSLPTRNLIKAFKLADGAPLNSFPMIAGGENNGGAQAGGRMALDGDGNLWVAQIAIGAGLVPLKGMPSGSAPFDGHAVEGAFDADDAKYFQSKTPGAFIALDFGAPHRIYTVHIKGGTGWEGAKLQGANDPNGPWTDLYTVKYSPGGWPEQWVTVTDPTPFRHLRWLSGPGNEFAINGFDPYTKSAPTLGKVLHLAPDGKKLGEIACDDPIALAWDAQNKRLLVADNSVQQILAYKNMDAPVLDTTFANKGVLGEKDGIFGGPVAGHGLLGPGRFDTMRGIGVDAQGTVYVGMVGSYGVDQTRLEAYSPDGTLKWRMVGLSFENHCAVNPLDETDVYTGSSRFKMDYSKRAGNEWSYVGTTVNMRKYPDDPRGNGTLTDVMRVIGGKPFLFAGNRAVFKWDAAKEGNIAIPVAFFYGLNTGTPWPPEQPLGIGRFIWNDLNGDGHFQAGEYDKTDSYIIGANSIDDEGNYWMIPGTVTPHVIYKIAVSQKLDAHGNPQWHWDNPRNQQFLYPKPFDVDKSSINGMNYDVASKALFVAGFTPDLPNSVGGKEGFGRVLIRYAVADKTLTQTHRIELPYDVDLGGGPGDVPNTMSLAGDYIFVGYWNIQTVRIYRKSDLGFVGQYQVGRQSTAPILDGTASIKAFKRPNVNEYLIFHSNYVANSMMMVRWKPDMKFAPPSPAAFKVTVAPTSATLAWQPSADAAGYAIERMDHSPSGWSEWKEVGRAKTPDAASYTDTNLKTSQKYAYRMRAYNLGQGHGASDYTASVFIEAGQVEAKK